MERISTQEWYRGLDEDLEFAIEDSKIEFAVAVEREMTFASISRSELASRLSTSPAYITKLLRGDANCTIESMVKAAWALGGRLHLHIAPRTDHIRWYRSTVGLESTKVSDAVRAWQVYSEQPKEKRDARDGMAA
jgi:transcriptional regulator with XRE-family HTH domain